LSDRTKVAARLYISLTNEITNDDETDDDMMGFVRFSFQHLSSSRAKTTRLA
jgi:hypothetical protein